MNKGLGTKSALSSIFNSMFNIGYVVSSIGQHTKLIRSREEMGRQYSMLCF